MSRSKEIDSTKLEIHKTRTEMQEIFEEINRFIERDREKKRQSKRCSRQEMQDGDISDCWHDS